MSKQPTAKVTYTDGRTEEAPLTPPRHHQRGGTRAEGGMGSRRRQQAADVLLHGVSRAAICRKHTNPLRAVARLRGRDRGENPGKPYRIDAWPDGSLGRLSLILSARFGGSPWAWREKASELDWGAGIELLMEEVNHG